MSTAALDLLLRARCVANIFWYTQPQWLSTTSRFVVAQALRARTNRVVARLASSSVVDALRARSQSNDSQLTSQDAKPKPLATGNW